MEIEFILSFLIFYYMFLYLHNLYPRNSFKKL